MEGAPALIVESEACDLPAKRLTRFNIYFIANDEADCLVVGEDNRVSRIGIRSRSSIYLEIEFVFVAGNEYVVGGRGRKRDTCIGEGIAIVKLSGCLSRSIDR